VLVTPTTRYITGGTLYHMFSKICDNIGASGSASRPYLALFADCSLCPEMLSLLSLLPASSTGQLASCLILSRPIRSVSRVFRVLQCVT
jgi:hypothetical protein